MANGHGGSRPGAGRKAGGRNRATKEAKSTISELAQVDAVAALKALADIARNEESPASARVAAANAILDRAYGRPVQAKLDQEPDEEATPMVFNIQVNEPKTEVRITRPASTQGATCQG